MNDHNTFFTQSKCDRCGEDLKVRTTSWFTEETIGSDCMAKEKELKSSLRDLGFKEAFEGCGYVPNPIEEAQKQTAINR